MDFGAVGSLAINFTVMIVSVIIFGGIIVGSIFAYNRWKKFQEYKVVIWKIDGFGNISESYDHAGIFIDRVTRNKRLYLKKIKGIGLNADQIPFVPSRNSKIIYLLQTGLKNFHYIKPNIQMPKITLSVGEEDVNWASNSYERAKKRFAQDVLLQYMPFIALGVVSIIILVIFIYFFKEFATLKDVAASMKEAAQVLAQAKTGTVVIPS